MASFIVINSGSKGNAYILECKKEILLLELGVKWDRILQTLDYEKGIKKVCGCLITHKHKDHSKSIPDALAYQLPVYSNPEIQEIYEKVKVLYPRNKYGIGEFIVQPINVEHDVLNYAYLIEHREFGRLLYITDAISFPYKVKNINTLIVECNYSDDILLDEIINGRTIQSRNENHLELNECIKIVKRLYNSNLNNVVLVHLSTGYSDATMFKKRIYDEVGIVPHIAIPYLEVPLINQEF